MLTDRQIKDLVAQGSIKISDYDEGRIETTVYRVRLGAVLLVPVAGQTVDLRESGADIRYDRVEMDEEGFVLEPGTFLLGQTMESLALAGDVAAFIDGRSTLARLGISIHQSSTIIQPGQDAHIINLEIFNAGPFSVRIYPGLSVGKLIFFQLSEANEKEFREFGKYLGQSETTGARVKKE